MVKNLDFNVLTNEICRVHISARQRQLRYWDKALQPKALYHKAAFDLADSLNLHCSTLFDSLFKCCPAFLELVPPSAK